MAVGKSGELDFSNIEPHMNHKCTCNCNIIDRYHQYYRHEINRERSFIKSDLGTVWPHSSLCQSLMARSGFFYTGIFDIVRCFECCVLIGSWHLIEMSPRTVHRIRSSRCRYICGLPCGNVPSSSDSTTIDPMSRTHNAVMALYGDVINGNIRLLKPNNVSDSMDYVDSTTSGVVDDVRTSQYPQYAYYGDRLRSFDSWPITKVQTKEAMSYAGFYYTGKDDKTQCYHCGLKLCDWQPKDDPLLKHIRKFSKCMHIIKAVEQIISTKVARM